MYLSLQPRHALPPVPVVERNGLMIFQKAAQLIASFQHFRTVITTPTLDGPAPDWRDYSLMPLPAWLSIARLTDPSDALYYHSALLITFSTSPLSAPTPKKRASLQIHPAEPSSASPDSDSAECVIYTPHGIPHAALAPVGRADPPIHTLAFLHGLHDVSIYAAQQLNLGAKNGVAAQRILRAKYWVATHDEVKKGGGLISWFLQRKVWTLDAALKDARAHAEGEDFNMRENNFEDVRFEDVGNGESRVLE